MSTMLCEKLGTVEVLENQTSGCMQVFGLRWHCPGIEPYETLDEALAAGTLEVTEVSEGGSVPKLKVANKGDRPVFLMAGEQLVGAKQNRILNTSILVARQSELTIPVSCVEAGRWRHTSPKFASSGTMSHGKLRQKLSKQVQESHARGEGATSNQGEVWTEVSRKLTRMGSPSASEALQQSYDQFGPRLDDLIQNLQVSSACSGVAFVLSGRIVGVDLFDKSATLAKLWPKLARAYALDALEETDAVQQPLDAEVMRGWLSASAEVPTQECPSPGLGRDVRLRGEQVVGSCLVVEEEPLHAELFCA